MRTPDDRYPHANVDLLEKHGSEVARHPHASKGSGIPWKIACVHPNGPAEFHEIRHRRGPIDRQGAHGLPGVALELTLFPNDPEPTQSFEIDLLYPC